MYNIINEVITNLNEKQVIKICKTQKEYVIFRINMGNGGYGLTISVTNKFSQPCTSRMWNGYDFLLEKDEVIELINEKCAYKLANLPGIKSGLISYINSDSDFNLAFAKKSSKPNVSVFKQHVCDVVDFVCQKENIECYVLNNRDLGCSWLEINSTIIDIDSVFALFVSMLND